MLLNYLRSNSVPLVEGRDPAAPQGSGHGVQGGEDVADLGAGGVVGVHVDPADHPGWVDIVRRLGFVGGCPIGSLANELAETDPLARAQVARSFVQWETMIRDGLKAIAARGELPDGTEVDNLALATLAAIQGGLLLSQVRRDTAPLEAAVDTMIEHLRTLGVR